MRVGSVRRRAALMTLPTAAAATLLGPTPAVFAADPGGNNGTVKIDRRPFDSRPGNQPHVGCEFEVDFYGFDKGDLTATVTFAVQSPTGRRVLRQDVVAIGEDSAGGGTDLDAEQEYDLSAELDAFTPHPRQGFHVTLTVNAEGARGADTKHKVFWVRRCETPPPPPI
jgi:hypothetical protein